MTDLRPQRGFTNIFPYWGFQKATPDDLDRLINYTLTRLNPADTASIVDTLQHVDPDQQWGVWGAGPAMAPGNKDGWSLEDHGWVVNTVGFAGRGQRYTLAVTTWAMPVAITTASRPRRGFPSCCWRASMPADRRMMPTVSRFASGWAREYRGPC